MKEVHEKDLGVSLASVAWLGFVGFEGVAGFGYKKHGHALLLAGLNRVVVVLVEASVDLGHVVSLVAVSNGDVGVTLHLIGRDEELLHHGENDLGCAEIVA